MIVAGDRVIFAAPAEAAWSLPVYELALLAAHERRGGAAIMVVTAEPRPLGRRAAVHAQGPHGRRRARPALRYAPDRTSRSPLWWPSEKIVGRYITGYLAGGRAA